MSVLSSAASAAGKKASSGGAALRKAGVSTVKRKASEKLRQSGSGQGEPADYPNTPATGSAAEQAAEPENGGGKAAAAELGKSVLKEAAVGAATGAAGGLVGAGVGAAKGAAKAVVKSATGRKVLIWTICISLGMSLTAPAAFALITAQMIAQAAAGFSASNNDTSVKSALDNGQESKDVRAAIDLVGSSGIPWQIALSYKFETGKDLDIPKTLAALAVHDNTGLYRDINAGARYSSGTNARKVEGDEDKGFAAKVAAVWVPTIVEATGVDEALAKTIYKSAVGLALAQSFPACGTKVDSGTGGAGTAVGTIQLNPQQVAYATTIIGVAKTVWKDEADQRKASTIGIITAMQESTLRNLNSGDRDSVGLFQQRPSMGWGTVEQITTPDYSASAFFVGVKVGTNGRVPGLTSVLGWQALPAGVAAQKVQVSAFPDAYAKWEGMAAGIIAQKFSAAPPVAVPAALGYASSAPATTPGAGGKSGSLCVTPAPIGGGGDAQKPIYKFTPSDKFGPRGDIGLGTNKMHRGQDLSAACNTPIYSVKAGTVVGSGWLGTYGNRVMVDHGGAFSSLYAHMPDGGPLVNVGDKVVVGQQVGRVGTTGASDGCHLHFEAWVSSNRIDPVKYMKDNFGVDILVPSADPHVAK